MNDFLDVLAQLETQNGARAVKGTNNLFNIKDFSGTGGIKAFDKAEGSNHAYRVYGSVDESKADVQDLITRLYPKAATATTIEDFADGLLNGKDGRKYATDPKYREKLINTYNSRQNRPPVASAPIDLSPYAEKYASQIQAARLNGFSDQDIFSNIKADEDHAVKIQSAQVEAMPRITRDVKLGLARNGDLDQSIAMLRQVPGYSKEIDFAKSQGLTNEEIVMNLAPDALKGYEAFKKRSGTSFFGNVKDGFFDQIESYGVGAGQIVADVIGDKRTSDYSRTYEANRRADPERVALGQTVGGQVGNVLPDVGLGVATGGTGLVRGAVGRVIAGTLEGGALGALNPVVEGESRAANAALGAALSGGAQGLFEVGGKVLRKAPDAALDIKSRVVSERVANAIGIPLDSPNLNTDYFKKAATELSNHYDTILTGRKAFELTDPKVIGEIFDPKLFDKLDDGFQEKITDLLLDSSGNLKPGASIELRELHNLMKKTGQGQFLLNQAATTDPYKHEALGKLSDILGQAFDNSVARNSDLNARYRVLKAIGANESDLVKPSIKRQFDEAMKVEKAKPEYSAIQEGLKTADEKWGMLQVAEDVFRRSGGNPQELLKASNWDASIANKAYGSRFVKGTAPLQNIRDAVNAEDLRIKKITDSSSSWNNAGHIATSLAAITNPALIAPSLLVNNVLKRSIQAGKNKVGEIGSLVGDGSNQISKDRLKEITSAVNAGIKTANEERRIQDLGGNRRKADKFLAKALKLAKSGVVISPDSED